MLDAILMAKTTKTIRQKSDDERSGTVIETEDHIRQAILPGLMGQQVGPPVSVEPQAPVAEATRKVATRATVRFRPTARPPIPLLTVFDDGMTEGEVVRIRDHRFIIGRTEGDLLIPIDGRISARHVEITNQFVGGLHRWVVTDLQSKHGMFVRVRKTVLADKAEILVGNGRYRFDESRAGTGANADYETHEPDRGTTRPWTDGHVPIRPAALTELLGAEIGNRIVLTNNEYWIGSDPACPICRPDDAFCEPRHVRLYRKPKGGWHAQHNRTVNGLWLLMPQITVESTVRFQIGEQQFQLKVP